MNAAAIDAFLAKNEIFALFSAPERQRLIAGARTQTFGAGQILLQKDDEGAFCLLLLAGRVRISLSASSGKEILIDLLEPGALIGEMALLDGGRRSATVDAVEESACLRIDREPFVALLQENPQATLGLVTLLSGRLRRTIDQMEMIALQNLPARLARYLLLLADQYGVPSASGTRIQSGMKQSDLAGHLAASRESVNKILNIWQAKGLLSLLPQQDILLTDRAGIENIANNSME